MLLERYESDGDRRFSAEVYDAGVNYDNAGASLLGQDLAVLCREDEAAPVAGFLSVVQDDSKPAAAVFAWAAGGPALDEHGAEHRELLAALAAGFSRAGARSASG